MAQEQFAGPEYFTDFDPEAFAKQLLEQKAAAAQTDDAAQEEKEAEQ